MALPQPEFNDLASRNDAHFNFMVPLLGHYGEVIPMPKVPTLLQERVLLLTGIKQGAVVPCAVRG